MHSSGIATAQKQKTLGIKKGILICAFFFLYCTGFSQKSSSNKKQKQVVGTGSFYSSSLEGTETATGEIFHHSAMSAASNFFKLNTWVCITNLQNGKSVLVRINDRMSKGMAAIGRVADMTRTAAQQLGFLNRGLATVRVEEVVNY